MILTEAMAAGTPVVASDLDAFRRVLVDGSGALFPAGDPAALAAVLGELLDDPGRRAAMSAEAARVVAAYDWQVLAQRVVEVYESAIEATGATVVPEAPPVG
jgi:phosphatidylinositol alpha-mannosyltransferase